MKYKSMNKILFNDDNLKDKVQIDLTKPLSVFLSAPPGTGKTAGVIIPSILNTTSKQSIVVIDFKGELFEKTSKHRSKVSKVMYFNPTPATDISQGKLDDEILWHSVKWNPLSYKLYPPVWDENGHCLRDNLDMVKTSYTNISKALIEGSEKSGDWSAYAAKLWSYLALYIFIMEGDCNICRIFDALTPNSNNPDHMIEEEVEGKTKKRVCTPQELFGVYADLLKQRLEDTDNYKQWDNGEKTNNDEIIFTDIIAEFKGYATQAPNTFTSIVQSLAPATTAFAGKHVREATSDCDFTFQDLRGINGEATTLYILIKPWQVDRLSGLIRVFIEMCTNYNLDHENAWTPNGKKPLFILFLDEFPRLGKMTELQKLPALARGAGVSTFFVTQDFDQIRATYGQNGLSELLNTCFYKIYPAQNSLEANEAASKDIGDAEILVADRPKRPIKVNLPFYFKDEALLFKAGMVRDKSELINFNKSLLTTSGDMFNSVEHHKEHQRISKMTMNKILCNDNNIKEIVHSEIKRLGPKADLNHLDTSQVTSMERMFAGSKFTGNISKWDVGNVKNMSGMFFKSKFTGDISRWNTSKVEDMSSMFEHSKFTGDISRWNVSNVTSMAAMFYRSLFNGDISRWNTSKVKDMSSMFAYSKFTGDISKWDVSNIYDVSKLPAKMFVCHNLYL